MGMTGYLNDGTQEAPKLRVYLHLENLTDLRADTIWPGLEGLPRFQKLAEDGFEGVQTSAAPLPAGAVLPHCGGGRVNEVADADRIAAEHKARGSTCVTLHVGWGLEDDDVVARLVEAVLTASARHQIPMFIETHRATITQDMWRTLQIVKRFPEVRFNGDFSHYYTGQEMVYGPWETKLEALEPIFQRVAFMHGRIGNPGSMQVSIGDGKGPVPQGKIARDFVSDFRELWTRAMRGFLRSAAPGDYLVFCPELLWSRNAYAREFADESGRFVEESDRYQQALLYQTIARECFQVAQDTK